MKLSDYDCFCVYEHIDPRTKKPRYVGMGTPYRAYDIGQSERSKQHLDWFEDLLEEGHSIWSIVQIKHKDLSRAEALEEERKLIRTYKERGEDLFNVAHFTGAAIEDMEERVARIIKSGSANWLKNKEKKIKLSS